MDDEVIPLTEEEQLLNIFKRKAMRNAYFNNVKDSWFYKDANNPPHPSMAPLTVGDKCTVLNGYNVKLGIPSSNGKKTGILKADLANKLVSQKNVNKVIYDILRQYGNNFRDDGFQNDVRQQLEGKFFIMRYNNSSTRINYVDFNETENTTFERGEERVKISYKDYVYQQYGMKAGQKEICILKDRRDNGYLPQFAYLTLRSDECADVYDQVLEMTNQPIQERLNRCNNLVKILNKAESAAAIEREQTIKRTKAKKKVQHDRNINMDFTSDITDTKDNDDEEKQLSLRHTTMDYMKELTFGLKINDRNI